MGLRHRKSFRLGGGFRVNLSKSGVGYSWGGKGYRISKRSAGGVQSTISLLGTGLSYTTNLSRKKNTASSASTRRTVSPSSARQSLPSAEHGGYYDTQHIKNVGVSDMIPAGLDDLLSVAKKSLIMYNTALYGAVVSFFLMFANPVFFFAFACFLFFGAYVKNAGEISLNYDVDEEQRKSVAKRMESILPFTNSKKLWVEKEVSKIADTKYSGGAKRAIRRKDCKAVRKAPFPFRADTPAIAFSSGKDTLIFLPDHLFVIQGCKIGAIKYDDLSVSISTTKFIEDGHVPKDARVIDYTWQYVNKSGGPDKRFKNNRQLPVCLYGKLSVQSSFGLNTVILFSNSNLK